MFSSSLITGFFAGIITLALIEFVMGYIFIALNWIPESQD